MDLFLIDVPPRANVSSIDGLYDLFLRAEESGLNCAVNCASVEVFSAAAAQVMLSARKSFESCGREIIFQNFSEGMLRDLKILGLLTLIEARKP